MTEFIPYVIFIKKKGEPNFCFISANTSRVLGLPTEYFAKRTAVQSLSDCLGKERAEEIYNSMRSAPENGYYYDTPFIISKDCREITIRCAFSPIISDGRVSHYVCVVNDITADIESRELLSNSVELAKKSSKRIKPENEEMYKEVIATLATFDRPVTVSEILASGMLDIAKYSNQRIAALLKKGIENDEVVKVTDKKKSLFSIKSEE